MQIDEMLPLLKLDKKDLVGLLELHDALTDKYKKHTEKAALYEKLRLEVEARMLSKLAADKLDRVTIGDRTLSAVTQTVPRPIDWRAIEEWVYANRQWIVHRRLSSTAILALLDADPEALPAGIALDQFTKLSIRKARRAPEL